MLCPASSLSEVNHTEMRRESSNDASILQFSWPVCPRHMKSKDSNCSQHTFELLRTGIGGQLEALHLQTDGFLLISSEIRNAQNAAAARTDFSYWRTTRLRLSFVLCKNPKSFNVLNSQHPSKLRLMKHPYPHPSPSPASHLVHRALSC